jgi:hypothetical protein
MAQLPTGSTFHVATAAQIAAPRNTTIVTNATEAVVTSAAHGYSNGDILLVTSGWGRLNRRAVRIKSVTTDTFVLEGINTTNTNFYPATSGVGTVSKINAFTQVTTVMNPGTSGGEPKTVNYQFVESEIEYSINDGFTATSYTLELDADSISTAGYAALQSLTEVQTDTILRIVTRNGAIQLVPCTVALNESVQMQSGQINRVRVAFNGNNRAVRYAS